MSDLGAAPAATREELISTGMTPREANRVAVRASLLAALELGFARWGSCWLCSVIVLIIGMMGVIVWSEMVYDAHRTDACDQPLVHLLQALYAIIAIQVFHREIVTYILCYSHSTDGPVYPCRVVLFYRVSFLAAVAWPLVGAYMLVKTEEGKCSPALVDAVTVVTVYCAIVAVIAVIVPACFISVMLVLVRRGYVRMPRSLHAAPEGFVESLPVVPFDVAHFDDDLPDGFPSTCAICLDEFDSEQTISKTPCPVGRHAFHTECLRGWLNCSKTCPLCRHDMTLSEA